MWWKGMFLSKKGFEHASLLSSVHPPSRQSEGPVGKRRIIVCVCVESKKWYT